MKQRDLFLGLGILGAFSMSAATTPFQGSVVPAEGNADFYLYQVESGKWMQTNTTPGFWTTRAGLDKIGFDVEVIPIEGGYQLNPKHGHNNSVNGEGLYLDTGRAVTTWGLEPVTVDGVSNAYNIKMLATDVEKDQYLLGSTEDGLISDDPGAIVNTTWQFVTREERINKMKADLANGPVDATWLVPYQDFGREDRRRDLWVHKYISNGSGIGNDGLMHNSVREAWHNATDYVHYITLTDLPNGTYKMNVQGYYREDWDDEETWTKYNAGEAPMRAQYFAGASTGTFRHIASEEFETRDDYEGDWTTIEALGGLFIPNGQNAAASTFLDGRYQNEWIEAVVTDGTLTLGVIKREGSYHDWLVYDNVQLQYVSEATPEVDLTGIKAELSAVIAETQGLPATPAFAAVVAKANEALAGNNVTAIRTATLELVSSVGAVRAAKNEINNFNATLAHVPASANTTEAWELFNNATSKGDFENALKKLRFARRRACAVTTEDVFTGATPEADGQYYLYNLGQKQWLAGGSDWGAHAALNYVGIPFILEDCDAENLVFHIDTGLYNGDSKHYMNYRGYLDCDKAGGWKFIPVEGKENVYTIEQADYAGVYVAWNYDASVDQHMGDETTVGTENRDGSAAENLNAQWKLVTRAEREALIEKASLNNPVDISFMLSNPGFNQRQSDADWTQTNTSIWARGSNYNDFAVESWNNESCDLSQYLEDMPTGVFSLHVNGFYRNGKHEECVNAETVECPYLYATDDVNVMAYLPSILSESGKAPGEGATVVAEDETSYHFPQYVNQATSWFRSGLYNAHLTFNSENDAFVIGMMKEFGVDEDWVVLDNFRLMYYGKDTTVEAVDGAIEAGIEEVATDAVEAKADNRIFNLQGIEVVNPSAPGIYIQNGKKFVVR